MTRMRLLKDWVGMITWFKPWECFSTSQLTPDLQQHSQQWSFVCFHDDCQSRDIRKMP